MGGPFFINFQQQLSASVLEQKQVLAFRSCMGGSFFINFQQQLLASVLEQKQVDSSISKL